MAERENGRQPSELNLIAGTVAFTLLLGFVLVFVYLALGIKYGANYSFGFVFVTIYAIIGMVVFTWFRIWLLRNKKSLFHRGFVQLEGMWFATLIYLGLGISLIAKYVVPKLNSSVTGLVIAAIVATNFWIIETTTKTTVDIAIKNDDENLFD